MRLRAIDLSMERGGRRLFSGVGFEAEAGSALIVTGPNGAGKSSLLRGLCGFLPFASGRFALEGGDAERTLGEQAHYLGHPDALKGALTAGENLAFWAGALGGDPARAACGTRSPASASRMSIDFPVRALSAGQKRRVALARLLVAPRPLWLLDEPTTALDAAARAPSPRSSSGFSTRRDRRRCDPRPLGLGRREDCGSGRRRGWREDDFPSSVAFGDTFSRFAGEGGVFPSPACGEGHGRMSQRRA